MPCQDAQGTLSLQGRLPYQVICYAYIREAHCAHLKRGPKIFKKGTKRGPDFEQKGDLKGTKRGPKRGPKTRVVQNIKMSLYVDI